jgi:hypothetical protein
MRLLEDKMVLTTLNDPDMMNAYLDPKIQE